MYTCITLTRLHRATGTGCFSERIVKEDLTQPTNAIRTKPGLLENKLAPTDRSRGTIPPTKGVAVPKGVRSQEKERKGGP